MLCKDLWGLSTILYARPKTVHTLEDMLHPCGDILGSPVSSPGFFSLPSNQHVVIKRLRYGMIVWITLQRHPLVVEIRAIKTVLPFRGIRSSVPGWKHAGQVRHVWANIGEEARGMGVVKTRLERWLEVKSGVGIVTHSGWSDVLTTLRGLATTIQA